MLTRTHSIEEIENKDTQEKISNTVNERGFYLYEWISSDELRMTLERDYLEIVQWASLPLAVITAIIGFIGFSAGIIGTIMGVLGVLSIFYGIVGIILTIRFFHRSYLYTIGANVVITDNHYVSGGNIMKQSDTESVQKSFQPFEEIFDEPFLGESKLEEKKEKAKKELFEKLTEIAGGGGKILQNIGNSRDSGNIAIVLVLVGFLYASIMGLVYFMGIFFISLFGRIFAWFAHRYLIFISNTEYKIQTLFSRISKASEFLENEKITTINLLEQANENLWKDNLTDKINTSIKILSTMAGGATDDIVHLKEILENSQYKNIFNFQKYGNWSKRQILEPIESILELIRRNQITLKEVINQLESQIADVKNPALAKPVFAQKERLQMQLGDFERVKKMLEGYKEKLI